MSKNKGESVPAKIRPIYDDITALIDAVCREHLDVEYAMLARKMAAALARKRPSPLERGRTDV
jgi:BMFP domain-containing protein YqiC